MDRRRTGVLRRLLANQKLEDAATHFASTLGSTPRQTGSLLVVGTPLYEPWHFVAHLAEEAQGHGRAELTPTWVRWRVPDRAPAHLAVGLGRLADVGCRETLLVIAPGVPGEQLLERVADARRKGAVVMTVDENDRELHDLAHEALSVPTDGPTWSFDVVQHIVTDLAPSAPLLRHR